MKADLHGFSGSGAQRENASARPCGTSRTNPLISCRTRSQAASPAAAWTPLIVLLALLAGVPACTKESPAQVITQWPGHAAEEVEQQITVPLEVELNGVAHLTHLRSVSLMGLSVITIICDDDITTFNARQEVLDRLQNVTLPAGVSTGIGPTTARPARSCSTR